MEGSAESITQHCLHRYSDIAVYRAVIWCLYCCRI